MALQYRIDVMKALKKKGITSYTIRKKKLLSETTLQKFRKGIGVSWGNVERLCKLLQCQPGDILEYIPDKLSAEE